MNSPRLRIFLVTSHISLIYATLLAKGTRREGQADVLLVDANKRRKALSSLLKESAAMHDWSLFHDFSILTEEMVDIKPTFRQTVMRRIKNKPLIRHVYNFLRERHLDRMDHNYRGKLESLLTRFTGANSDVSLFLLTQTYLNRPLRQLFPDAQLNYIEHGLPDYFNMLEPDLPKGNLYCVFADGYKHYLEKRNLATGWVRQLPGLDNFPQFAQEFIDKHLEDARASFPAPGRDCVFILMEAVDIYNVGLDFYVEYIRRILAQLPDAKRYHYLLKPHPMQSEESIRVSTQHLDEQGYGCTLLGQAAANVSAEVLFAIWQQHTKHVFCVFSAAGFYLSKLYADPNITYWYSTAFMSGYTRNAPSQFRDAFQKARPLIEEALSENCRTF